MPVRPDLKSRLPLIIGAVLFLFNGLLSFDQGDSVLGGANVAMAVVNFVALRFIARASAATNATLAICNALLAAVVAWSYAQAGKVGLPYAWGAVAVVYLGAAAVIWRRGHPRETSSQPSAKVEMDGTARETTARSVRGTITINPSDPDLRNADTALRGLFQSALEQHDPAPGRGDEALPK